MRQLPFSFLQIERNEKSCKLSKIVKQKPYTYLGRATKWYFVCQFGGF